MRDVHELFSSEIGARRKLDDPGLDFIFRDFDALISSRAELNLLVDQLIAGNLPDIARRAQKCQELNPLIDWGSRDYGRTDLKFGADLPLRVGMRA
ncbi:MAG: hypothetical protein AAF762_15075, partial [Pseudomonadota bacterium]